MDIEKHIQITGNSSVSWKDAIIKTVERVSETISDLTSVKVLDQRARINNSQMVEYFVDLDITFKVANH